MNKKTILVALIIILVSISVVAAMKKSKTTNIAVSETGVCSASNETNCSPNLVEPLIADKIEVVHFHGTQQCSSCIAVGKYAKQTNEENFPEEYKSGKIVFKDINGELKENQFMVMKYKASGSSLFVNTIIDGKDNIKEDTKVWSLVNSEEQYIKYFKDKINTLLGK